MKILIADDEKLVRYSLMSMIEEMKLSTEIVGEAGNGEEMIDLVNKRSPDIAFVDIKMPRLNGLDAIKIAREISPRTKWIILTSYSEFDYAKEAISLGAAAYLLKPVSPEELSETINDMIKENKKENIVLNEKFESKINALFNNTSSLQHEQDIISKYNFSGSIIVFDSSIDEKSKVKYQINFCNSIRERISETLTNDIRIALFTLPNGELATIGAWEMPAGKGLSKQIVERYFNKLLSISRQYESDNFCVTLLQTTECSSYTQLFKQMQTLSELSSFRAVLEIGRRITLEDLVKHKEKPHFVDLCNSLTGLSDAYREKNYLAFLKKIEELEKILSDSDLTRFDPVKRAVSRFLHYSIDTNDTFPLSHSEDHQWIHNLGEKLKIMSNTLLAEKQKTDEGLGDIVSQVTAFVEKNYMHDIGIAQIAYRLNITPNYLSTLFHKKTGTTFIKYLTKLRMSKSEELLMDPAARVKHVAGKVGYYSTRHFTKLFKNQFNCNPSEYKKRTDKS